MSKTWKIKSPKHAKTKWVGDPKFERQVKEMMADELEAQADHDRRVNEEILDEVRREHEREASL